MVNLQWYNELAKPAFTPAAEIFAPAWLILYSLIFISFLLYLKSKNNLPSKKRGFSIFFVQLVLNISWTPVFFGLKNPYLGLIIICVLAIYIILTIIEFYKFSKLASYLLLPYLVWVIFAIYLNAGIIILN